MIEVQSLSRYYGEESAIEDLSFQIQDKQVVGFLGLNGAGKSTTLKILATLLSPSSGSIVIDGNNYDDTSIAFRSNIGFLPEEPLSLSIFLRRLGCTKGPFQIDLVITYSFSFF